ncbi:hypothetical protein [Pantoea sp. 1.19]|uniref:HoxN/HupN/NixA family nickel/cobalt transporter n=1 Tax=Pantoea sp. 1.19 TaxID=1925589 RepID=UPI0009FA9D57|nr:hypothetical protein [Pantoea sp. 1.19]
MHRYLVMYLMMEQSGRGSGGVLLVAAGFLYGVLHALGPGHGKFVVTTWLATGREQARAGWC